MKRLRHPVRSISEPFGKAGVAIGVIALVFAMLGGAYAATGGKQVATASKKKKAHKKSNASLNSKQKKEVKKISQAEAKKFATAGPAGPAGAVGAAGPAGAKGDSGSAGSQGAAGVSATTEAFAGSAHGCTEGGVIVRSASPEAAVCNGQKGANGRTGFTETLPSESTETGVWTLGHIANNEQYPGQSLAVNIPLSFPIPLEAEINADHVHLLFNTGKEFNESFEEVTSTACTGSAAAPTAEPGNLCIYASSDLFPATGAVVLINPGGGSAFGNPATGGHGASTAGMVLRASVTGGDAEATGTWAVTAP